MVLSSGNAITLVGWGQTTAGGALPAEPFSGTSGLVSIDDTALVTGDNVVGCSGDSGGPMLSSRGLVAVVTSGDAQCNTFTIGLRLSAIGAWVTEVAGPGPVDPGVTAVSGTLTAFSGATVDIPFEFSSTRRPMTFDDIVDIQVSPEVAGFDGCDASSPPTVCHLHVLPDFVGTIVVTYTVSDGTSAATARWRIRVGRPPTPPVATNGLVHALPAVPTVIALEAADANGDALTYMVVTALTHGALAGCASGTCSYTSAPGFVGNDSFTWTASDGALVSNVATVSISVQPALPPTVTSGSATIVRQTPLELTLDAVDPNGDSVWFTVVTPPAHGTLTDCSLGACTCVADAGFIGADSFTWRAIDGVLTSALATFTVGVVPHLPPVVSDSALNVKRDSVRHIEFDGSDPEEAPVALTIVAAPQHGTVTNCTILGCYYRPEPGFVGTDSVRWSFSDGEFTSSVAVLTLEVAGGGWAVQSSASAPDALALAARPAQSDQDRRGRHHRHRY